MNPILDAWERLRVNRIPLVGYLSASRSGEAINFLRLQSCPYDAPDCATHCPGQTDRAPCQVLDPLKDAALWAMQLEPGQRSPLWRSSARILDLYGDHRIYFCYVHVGTEIARIEFPAWVAEDSELLDSALSLTLMQVQKGYGYPIALAEAHNQAVVRGAIVPAFCSSRTADDPCRIEKCGNVLQGSEEARKYCVRNDGLGVRYQGSGIRFHN